MQTQILLLLASPRHRFAEDAKSKTLSSRMTDLLLNSYFPQGAGVTGSKQVRWAQLSELLPVPLHSGHAP